MIRSFLEAVKARRSLYGISARSTLPDGALAELVEDCLTHVPSAFNSQSARAVLLLGDAHSKLWNGIVLPTLRARVPAEKFASTENKIASFAAGYGTILYFDDTAVTGALAERFPTYAQNFPIWAQQANGMLQFTLWTALEDAGMGASLQHYNPLIDGQVRAAWELPESWQLIAQMPFGVPTTPAGDKQVQDGKTRMRVFS